MLVNYPGCFAAYFRSATTTGDPRMARPCGSVLCSVFLALALAAGCGGGSTVPIPSPPSPPVAVLTAAEAQSVVQNSAIAVDAPVVIAVTDRGGHILAVFQKTGRRRRQPAIWVRA